MPELPEVETIRRGLNARITGRKIADISFDWAKSFQGDKAKVVGRKIESVERRAKTIQVKLDNDYSLLFHLKMTGQLVWRQESKVTSAKSKVNEDFFAGGHPDHDWHAELPNKHTRIVFDLDDGSRLFFNDLRKFGWCKVLTNQEIIELNDKNYGPEPFDSQFNAKYLHDKAVRIPTRKIKQFLLDQTIVAGIGNIYADEILFDTTILPTRKVKEISVKEWQKIVESTIRILSLAISQGGTTDSDYVNAEGKKGGMQNYLKVYHKAGERCANNCGTKIIRTTIGGRGTHYCESCQK